MNQQKAWEQFNVAKAKTNYPQWPNEVMLKLVFGSYLGHRVQLKPEMRVLDVGCGFGNNLLPFLVRGYHCCGVEVTEEMSRQTQDILAQRGFSADIRFGNNRDLPFEDGAFDLLLAMNVIHYEANIENVRAAFAEYHRVLAKGGKLLLMTVGPKHAILKDAKTVAAHVYEIHNYDFRDGSNFFAFDNETYLKECLDKTFNNVETGRVQEGLMTVNLDFLVAAGESRK